MAQSSAATNKKPANDVSEKDPELKDLYAMLDILKNDMQALSKTVSEVGKAEARRAVETAKAKGREVRGQGEEQLEALRAQAEEYGRATNDYVRENPAAALGIAAGLGFLIGFVLSSRR